MPRRPADLDPAAQAVWERVLADQAPGVILAAHTDTFRMYCEAVARYGESAALLRASGPLVIDRHHGGGAVKNPLHQIVRDNATLVRQLAGDLGLNPSAMSSIHAVPEPRDSAMARLLVPRRRMS